MAETTIIKCFDAVRDKKTDEFKNIEKVNSWLKSIYYTYAYTKNSYQKQKSDSFYSYLTYYSLEVVIWIYWCSMFLNFEV